MGSLSTTGCLVERSMTLARRAAAAVLVPRFLRGNIYDSMIYILGLFVFFRLQSPFQAQSH